MIKNNKAQGISITTIIIALLALIVLVVLVGIFTGKLGNWGQSTDDIGDTSQYVGGILEKGSSCSYKSVGEDTYKSSGKCKTAKECSDSKGDVGSAKGLERENICKFGLVCCTK